MSVVEQRMEGLNRGFDALEQRDIEGVMAIIEENVHPKVEFTSGIGSVLGGGAYRGIDGLRSWFTDLLDTVGDLRYKERRFEALDDEAFLFFAQFELTGGSSGIELSTEVGQLYELEDGLIRRGVSFMSHAEARAAAEAAGRQTHA